MRLVKSHVFRFVNGIGHGDILKKPTTTVYLGLPLLNVRWKHLFAVKRRIYMGNTLFGEKNAVYDSTADACSSQYVILSCEREVLGCVIVTYSSKLIVQWVQIKINRERNFNQGLG